MHRYNWATLGCGVIANELAKAMALCGDTLYSVANRTHQKAVDFASQYGIKKVYDSMYDVFDDKNVDIIYISTPHNTHIDFLRRGLINGKHILCEKSITLNSDELIEAKELAKKNRVILAEAMTIYHMPLYKKLALLIKSGSLGELRVITMNFGSYKDYDMTNRFFNRSLAGGSMLDIGVYALSFIRWFLQKAPNKVMSQVKLAPTGVDEQASILLQNPDGVMATVMLSLHSKQPKRGTVSFDKGYIEIFEYPRGVKACITYLDGRQEIIESGSYENALFYEIEDMERAVSGEKNEMHLDYTQDVMKIMTDIRKDWGMRYPSEESI